MRKFLAVTGAVAVMGVQQSANPIRRVVTLMQNMQKEIEAEGEKEEDLYKKFQCYCKGNTANLSKAGEEAASQISELNAKVKSEQAEKGQLEADLKQHRRDRADAKQDLEKATKIREKENKEFVAEAGDTQQNIESTGAAISALEGGMGAGSFLQTPVASHLKTLPMSTLDVDEREALTSFLEQSGDYIPQSGQIVGILKNMKDEMEKSLGSLKENEDAAAKSFAELKAAKKKEISAATSAIESKMQRAGELAVSIVENQNAAKDAGEDLSDAQKFLANLSASCKQKAADWEVRTKTRQEEIQAISEAIAVLNDDDALDIFKSSLPSPKVQQQPAGMQFLQKSTQKANPVVTAKDLIASNKNFTKNPAIALLAHTLTSKLNSKNKAVDFSSVIKMIDDMVALLNKEQADDESHKQWCESEFDGSDDEKKATTQKLNKLASSIDEMKSEIEALSEKIASLETENKELDQSVTDATAQRKEEHADYIAHIQLNEAAIQLIFKAKNRLQKFYNPGQHVAQKQREPTEEERLAIAAGEKVDLSVHTQIAGTQQFAFIQLHNQNNENGPELAAAPETFEGGYEKKNQKSNSIMGLMDMLTKDLETEIHEAEMTEKQANKDYEELVADAQATRAQNVKSINGRSANKADLEGKLEDAKSSHIVTSDQLDQINGYIADLHQSCDFIVANFEVRREARNSETESLKNAKAVLSGADYA